MTKHSELKAVSIFTDGACCGNPGAGGWAAILKYGGHQRELAGAVAHTTNQRMELAGAIAALQALKMPCAVTVTSDSSYLIKGMSEWLPRWVLNGWKNSRKQPVENRDLWEELVEAAKPHLVSWVWVKGHDGHPENERADQLAAAQAKSAQSLPGVQSARELTPS